MRGHLSLVFLLLWQREMPVCRGALPQSPHQGVLPCSPDSRTLALTEGPLGLGALVLFPRTAAVQVAPPLLAGWPLTVDVVVVQKVSSTAAELPLRAVGLAGARRPPATAVSHVRESVEHRLSLLANENRAKKSSFRDLTT